MPVHIKSYWKQSCGAGSREDKFKLPPGAGPEITNCCSGSFLFTTEIMAAEEIFVNCYNFNPITLGQKNGTGYR